ncbi:hypothetical protein [Streptomyces meridianus]|uniref:PH domain-containing protein n=1 Tax=Streptomyces meridianus TaxID=2938945 RepID=A0ABT0XC78_9ACTN|nr:hypothetical protein [Streptomyces meridianus]MCM2579870.1 hypothetical protein [Streptomyces meridianus]
MPLPFLTAERAVNGATADPALPYEDRERWRRPYRPGPGRVAGAAVLLLLASYILFAAVIIAVAGGLPGAGVCTALATGVIVLALRLVRSGVWVSRTGIRRIGLVSTSTHSWPEVRSVRTVQQPVKWLGMPRTVQGQAVLIDTADGGTLRPLVTDRNADFLGRAEAFDMAADAVEGWAAAHGR